MDSGIYKIINILATPWYEIAIRWVKWKKEKRIVLKRLRSI